MSRDLNALFGAEPRQLPGIPETAFMVGCLFTKLGGTFTIGSNGQRYIGRPTSALYRYNGEALPQLPNTKPHHQFQNEAEWEGALKVVETLLDALDEDDKAFLFDCFAPVAIDESALTPSIEEPKRRAA